MSEKVTVNVTYVNENKDAGGGPYIVTIKDKWGKGVHTVTGKTIRRNGTFQAAVEKLLDQRFAKMTAKDKQEALDRKSAFESHPMTKAFDENKAKYEEIMAGKIK